MAGGAALMRPETYLRSGPERAENIRMDLQGQYALTVGWFVVCALMCVTCWPIFTKAGEPGWKCLIPIYGAFVFMRIVGRPWWWVLWMCVPFLGLIPALIV